MVTRVPFSYCLSYGGSLKPYGGAADDLIDVASAAAQKGHRAAFAVLAKELRKLYPADLEELCRKCKQGDARLTKAVLDEWASEVSSRVEQLAAVRKREEAVACEQAAVQQMILAIAGMAKHAEQAELAVSLE
jgi:hypothetical protein